MTSKKKHIQSGKDEVPTMKGIRGQVLTFKADPFFHDEKDCYDFYPDGLVAVRDGKILDVGHFEETIRKHPG